MSSSHFITNDPDRNLASVINGIIPGKTESMDFLVGYFYFTGIEQFAENVKDKRLRILIGKDLDPKLVKMSSATQSLFDNSNKSTNQIREGYKQTVIDLINNSAHYEDKQNVAAYRIYMDKLKNGTLEIRLTKEPWHAKLYIFNYYDEQSENGETLGLNTWWVGGTYNRKGVQEKSEGAKPVGIIAVGYGQTQGVPHKTKTAEQVSSYNGEAPQWFKDGIEAALLAPTALAKQAFTISGTENRVSISCNNGIFTGVDTGLVKYHFELGAGKDSFEWA